MKALALTLIFWLMLATTPAQMAVGKLTIEWDPNAEVDLAGYHVYEVFGENDVHRWATVEAPATRITLNQIAVGKHTFFVTAFNTQNLESEPSETVSTPKAAGAVENVRYFKD